MNAEREEIKTKLNNAIELLDILVEAYEDELEYSDTATDSELQTIANMETEINQLEIRIGKLSAQLKKS